LPAIQEHGPFYWHCGKLYSPKWGLGTVPVRQYEWPYKLSTGLVIRAGRFGVLLGFWRKNPELYSLSEEDLLIKAIEATEVGYFKEQQIGHAGNIEWVPIEAVKGIKGNW
jgi:hypothetical protein